MIAELGLRAAKTAAQIAQFREYVQKVNLKINLVSRANSESVVDDLIFDSLSMLKHLRYSDGAKLLDIGSGAGFPWVIHKIANPSLVVATIDANRKKVEFQRAAARLLGFKDCAFYAERAENVASLGVDYATAKAFGSVELIGSLAGPHLKSGGQLVLPRSGGEGPITAPTGFALVASHVYKSTSAGRISNLHIFKKI
ncbi:MAG: 16S rRNA (guanine(527)-N(7))-methyltransferase RsmG [Candidatus Zixiibacteriota bacterium]